MMKQRGVNSKSIEISSIYHIVALELSVMMILIKKILIRTKIVVQFINFCTEKIIGFSEKKRLEAHKREQSGFQQFNSGQNN